MNTPTVNLADYIVETVSVRGTLKVEGHEITISQNNPLVQDKSGNIFPLDLSSRYQRPFELGVEEELIVLEDATGKGGNHERKVFVRIA